MPSHITQARPIVKGRVEASALVCHNAFSFMGDVDMDTGVIIAKGHEHEGETIAGRVMIYPETKGSSGGCIVLMTLDALEYVIPVLTIRQSIYIDPQVPVQVEQKVYEAGEPDEKAPLLVTTNFSLTFYSVLGEVEASRVSARILAVDTEGTSVLTAWAADKFGAEQVAAALKKTGALEQLDEAYRKPVIPGLVAVISGELEEEAGCGVIVGPKEASALPNFLKNEWRNLVG